VSAISPDTEVTEAAAAQEAEGPRARRALLLAALAVATPVWLVLAAAGAELVPGAAPDQPRWILGPLGEGLGVSPRLYLIALYVAIGLWLAIVAAAATGRRMIWIATAFAVALFAVAPPLLSLDVFSYLSYARLGAEHGLNPYEWVPAAIPDDPAAERVGDFQHAVSVYGPLFTVATYPLGLVGVEVGLWTMKALAAISVAAIALLTARIAVVRGVDPAPAVALVALNPLVLVHVVGGAHNDGAMVALALVGALAVLAARPAGAAVALVAAAAVKASGALYLPFALAGSPQRPRLLLALVVTAALVAGLALLAFGAAAGEALGVAGENQRTVSRWSVPGTVSRIAGWDVDAVRLALAVGYLVAFVSLVVWVLRGADWLRAAGWAAAGLLVATAWMVPWYLIWLLPLAAVSRDRGLLVVTVALTAFQAPNAVPL
jgi:hypothetical protein